ncbi:MAG: M48 family metalloprotease [Solirubrobacterales bacterium]
MRSRPETQHTFFAVGVILLAGLVADLVLWPRDQLPAALDLAPGEFFSQAYIDRAESFRWLQSWLGIAGLAMLVAVPLVVALRWPARWRTLGDARTPRHRRSLTCASIAAAIGAAALAAALPFEFFAFLRARHYGLVVQGAGGWLWNWLLGTLLVCAALALLGLLAGWLIRRLRRAWWPVFGVLLILLAIVFQALAPSLIEPLFADFKPLPAGETRSDVERLARAADVHAGKVYLVDAASRTNGANAYVTGLGSTKRVVIYDTLLRDFNRPERRAVVAHELGHAHYSDLSAGLLWFGFVAMVCLFAVDLLARAMATHRDVEFSSPAAIAMLAAAAMVAIALSQPAANAYSRQVEARADAFALQVTRDPNASIALERRLTVRNIARPQPPALLQFLFGTHPTPMQRIGMAETVKREQAAP